MPFSRTNGVGRREVIKAAAWAVPVVALAVATPLTAASQPPKTPISCVWLKNHGHGGDKGNTWWQVTYSDGSQEVLDNGTVMSDPTLKGMCYKS